MQALIIRVSRQFGCQNCGSTIGNIKVKCPNCQKEYCDQCWEKIDETHEGPVVQCSCGRELIAPFQN
ncbi:MAG: hypothetical protein COV55_01760 [Candidatus Komeilibacteria bacterium CG11_big_fil_rev_8_21_14_0_20_36_20]|uniref:Uncharacterized protein n=1 Tax=Candidatus Komeilibacteria bacterium CG11_big_fil_rev_8_21_14_0_20_36_20 TaxID=1974477 RepID=A0A2H0NE15_9BACT|nr:MAG: hypothetical protein COV55_01760 [Candidatus Komeilibacteria bacterium CG11_big_fil_rev_8_21_14_0_20_36_20]PIR81269.1 MAG: hypothetical protein COU21_04745 [Candidatus Komeilibacteria bacterium CG10_big_fil_rev_8_21_14_0_10_36_65]PJC55233.1 MAG: hypothetical protein CO027_03685 [Candidatus Komeilibacteria bacterium CG_4_9_14_0_2_um_filter_36_13]